MERALWQWDAVELATVNGVVAYMDLIAKHDRPPVANWRRAGAVIDPR
jgi:hypothetical protein